MNKKILVFCYFVYFFTDNYAYTHTKIRDNNIYFSGDVTSVNFQKTSKCITHGQPFDNTIYTIPYHGLNIRAGRKGSKTVVKCIKKNNKQNIFKNHFGLNKKFGKLNFAIQGNLTINGVKFNDIILVQGNVLFRNNWWFGGKNCKTHYYYEPHTKKYYSTTSVECTSDDGKTSWCFTRLLTNGLHDKSYAKINKIKIFTNVCNYAPEYRLFY